MSMWTQVKMKRKYIQGSVSDGLEFGILLFKLANETCPWINIIKTMQENSPKLWFTNVFLETSSKAGLPHYMMPWCVIFCTYNLCCTTHFLLSDDLNLHYDHSFGSWMQHKQTSTCLYNQCHHAISGQLVHHTTQSFPCSHPFHNGSECCCLTRSSIGYSDSCTSVMISLKEHEQAHSTSSAHDKWKLWGPYCPSAS